MAEARSIHSFFLTAPNQHRPFCDLAGRTAQPCPSPALCALFPHPLQNRVPRGERAPVALRREPVSAPAPVGAGRSPPGSSTRAGRRDQVLLPLPKIALLLLQWRCFLSLGGTSWQQGAPAGSPAVRVVGTCSPVGCVQRRSQLPLRSVLGAPHWGAAPEPAGETSPSAPATKPAKTLDSRRFSFCTYCVRMGFILVQTAGFCTWFYLFPTVPIPSSTKNTPGFAFFGLFRVRFSLFRCFWGAKFLPALLCILPHSGYKLKPSVMPCRREVSFLT